MRGGRAEPGAYIKRVLSRNGGGSIGQIQSLQMEQLITPHPPARGVYVDVRVCKFPIFGTGSG